MSDSAQTFRQKNEAQFVKADKDLEEIGLRFTVYMAAELLERTPGPNKQLQDTEYFAVGRLMGSLTWTTSPIGASSRWDGGPLDEDGAATLATIESAVRSAGLKPLSYLEFQVAYGYQVHEGWMTVPYYMPPRPWVAQTAKLARQISDRVLEEVGRG